MRWIAATYPYEWRDLTLQAEGPPQQPGPVTPVAGPHVRHQDSVSHAGRVVAP